MILYDNGVWVTRSKRERRNPAFWKNDSVSRGAPYVTRFSDSSRVFSLRDVSLKNLVIP